MKNNRCERCDSNKIIEKVKITDLGHANQKNNLSIYIQSTNRTFCYKSVKREISAKVCCSCGKIELSIDNPDEFWNAYLQKKS